MHRLTRTIGWHLTLLTLLWVWPLEATAATEPVSGWQLYFQGLHQRRLSGMRHGPFCISRSGSSHKALEGSYYTTQWHPVEQGRQHHHHFTGGAAAFHQIGASLANIIGIKRASLTIGVFWLPLARHNQQTLGSQSGLKLK